MSNRLCTSNARGAALGRLVARHVVRDAPELHPSAQVLHHRHHLRALAKALEEPLKEVAPAGGRPRRLDLAVEFAGEARGRQLAPFKARPRPVLRSEDGDADFVGDAVFAAEVLDAGNGRVREHPADVEDGGLQLVSQMYPAAAFRSSRLVKATDTVPAHTLLATTTLGQRERAM